MMKSVSRRPLLAAGLAGALALFGGAAQAQTKWDLPSAYPASNFHTENLQPTSTRRRAAS